MHAHVTKILIDPHTGVAYGVKFKRNGKMWIVHARKEIILSAGSLFFNFENMFLFIQNYQDKLLFMP